MVSRTILSRMRLPIPPQRQLPPHCCNGNYFIIQSGFWQEIFTFLFKFLYFLVTVHAARTVTFSPFNSQTTNISFKSPAVCPVKQNSP